MASSRGPRGCLRRRRHAPSFRPRHAHACRVFLPAGPRSARALGYVGCTSKIARVNVTRSASPTTTAARTTTSNVCLVLSADRVRARAVAQGLVGAAGVIPIASPTKTAVRTLIHSARSTLAGAAALRCSVRRRTPRCCMMSPCARSSIRCTPPPSWAAPLAPPPWPPPLATPLPRRTPATAKWIASTIMIAVSMPGRSVGSENNVTRIKRGAKENTCQIIHFSRIS
jgi:hypothetical protein